MYEFLQKHKTLTVAVIAVASAGFFLWLFFAGGVEDFLSPSKKCVAEVGSSCITIREYQRELARYSDLMQNREMEALVREQVLSNLIAQALLYEKAKELSLIASDEEVVEVIKSDPTFAEGGIFSASKYKEMLARNGLSPEEYEERIRKLLSIQKVVNLITNSVYITQKEKDINLQLQATLLSGKLYIISPSEIQLNYQPSEKELLEYYRQNKELFKTQGERILLLWKEKDKEKASAIYKDLKEGKTPQGYEEVKLPQQEDRLTPILKAQAQRLNQENRIDLLKEGDTYVVLYLKEIKPPGYEEFDKVKDKVKEKLLEQKRTALLETKAKEAVESLKKGNNVPYKHLNFSDTPAQQLTAVFDMDQDSLLNLLFSKDRVFGPYKLAQGYGVLLIEERKKRELKEDEARDTIRSLLDLKANALVNAYIENLRKNTKVKINKELTGG